MAQHNTYGKVGEDIAANWLEKHGYTILDRNWRLSHLELDIVCSWQDLIVVVEVKSRKNGCDVISDLISESKRRNLLRAGAAYIRKKGWENELRFDLIIVSGENGEVVQHIQEAILVID